MNELLVKILALIEADRKRTKEVEDDFQVFWMVFEYLLECRDVSVPRCEPDSAKLLGEFYCASRKAKSVAAAKVSG